MMFGLWFYLALGCALLTAGCDAVSKRLMQENDVWITGTILLGLSAVMLAPIVLHMEFGPVSRELIVVLVIAVPLEVVSYYLFLSAIRMAPLSLTVPLLSFTPVLTILTGAALLGETVSPRGSVGVALVAIGAYVLNGDLISQNFLAPVRALFSNPGARRMLAVAIIWSVSSALGKKGILIYGAMPFAILLICGNLTAFALVSAFRLRSGSAAFSCAPETLGLFLLGGLLLAAAEASHFIALSMAPVAYMISVKRLSLVFSVIFGWLVFKESNIGFRLVGASVMVAGVFLLYN
jgi:drug/metabolite transporter (DMT)-like permease